VTFDQAMQAGQVTNFSQFTSTVLRWVEDSCRPMVNKSIDCLFSNEIFLLFRMSMKLFVELLEIPNHDSIVIFLFLYSFVFILLIGMSLFVFFCFIFYRNITSFFHRIFSLCCDRRFT